LLTKLNKKKFNILNYDNLTYWKGYEINS